MNEPQHSIDDLKGPAREHFQAIDWTIQRCCWCAAALILVAALLGLFGQGPLVHRRVSAPDNSLTVDYHAVERYGSPTEMTFRVHSSAPGSEPLQLRISKRFCDETSLENIVPLPLQSTIEGADVVYSFAVRDIDTAEIVLRYKHEEPGALAFEVGIPGHASIALQQYVLP